MSEVQSPAVAEPGTSEAGWHPDPCGRYHYRYWDGNRWTAAVSFNGETKQDQIPVSAESGRDEDPSHTWIADSDLGGLYVLHVDHEAVAATSFVDRKLRLSEQLDALNAVDWPAAGHIEFVRRDIASGTMSTPFTGSLPGNRRLSPFATTNLAAVIDTGEEPSEHPVRRYCHPDLTTSGDLVLDSGEQVIATWKTFEPTLEACTADGS
ncbi:MAG TPA: DUF2510 domain-containing protein, partial [Baekduia sp.]|nr:DUF2510 domain-containing protein [Baekduia sp.]